MQPACERGVWREAGFFEGLMTSARYRIGLRRRPAELRCRVAAMRLRDRAGATNGAGIVWFEITKLTKTCFSEREMTAWDGQAELSMEGLHSFDQLGPLQAIDFNCSVGRGVMRRNISTIAPRHDGNLERSFPGASHCLQLDQV